MKLQTLSDAAYHGHGVPLKRPGTRAGARSTNEREGSDIAGQIVEALLEKGIKIVFVTHLYGFARGCFDRRMDYAMFLRAERGRDGTRTFRVIEGEPLETSCGPDLYGQIFEGAGTNGDEDIGPEM